MPSDPHGLLFDPPGSPSAPVDLGPGAAHLPGFAADLDTQRRWPALPALFERLAASAAQAVG